MRKLFAAVLLLFAGTATAFAENAGLASGDMPPSYLGMAKEYGKLHVEDFNGQVVVVTFWASWCAPCLKELPILNEIQKQVGGERLKVIAVNYKDSRRNMRKVQRFSDDWQLIFSSDPSEHVALTYGVKSIPHMFMIDHEGKIAGVHIGYGESAIYGIVDELNALLAAQASMALLAEEPAAD